MSEESGARILIVDDEPFVCEILSVWLSADGHSCSSALEASSAQKMLEREDFDLVICDIMMPGMSGVDFLSVIKSYFPDVAVIMVTAVDDRETAVLTLKLGAYGYLIKPLKEDDVLINVANALERRRLVLESQQYERSLEAKVEERTSLLREREEALKQAKEDLERKVEERTAELSESNEQLKKEISERIQAEEALRESEGKYRRLVENSPVGIISCDMNGAVTEINSAVETILGPGYKASSMHMNLLENAAMTEARIADAVHRCIESGKPNRGEYPFNTEHRGQTFLKLHIVPLHGPENRPVGAQLVLEDVSDSKKAESLRLRAERLKAVVEMSSAVHRFFYNSLRNFAADTEEAIRCVEERHFSELKPLLSQMRDSAHQSVHTLRRVQQFARARTSGAAAQTDTFDLSSVVKEAVERRELWWRQNENSTQADVSVKASLAPDCTIEGESEEIIELVGNLLQNAVEAMSDGGVIEVKTISRGSRAVLQVTDTGVGVSRKNVERMFDPFWSTKTSHEGMGLAVALGIIRRHRGTVSVTSKEKAGTTFTVEFPKTVPKVADEPSAPAARVEHTYRILLVDEDEAAVRKLEEGLKELGQTTVVAFSYAQAISIFGEGDFDAVVCGSGKGDLSCPEVRVGIAEVCAEKQLAEPPFVTLVDGPPAESDEDSVNHPETGVFLEKPVDPAQLFDVVDHEIRNELTQVAFSGSIYGIDILEYLQILLFTGQRVVVEIVSKKGDKGLLYVDKGEFIHAECGDYAGEEALHECLKFRGGSFSSLPWKEPEQSTIKKSGEFILMEAARRRDESRSGGDSGRGS